MIRIYPSRLESEPVETHAHKKTSLYDWFFVNVDGFTLEHEQPIVVEINGIEVATEHWSDTIITGADDVCIYPKPYASGFAAGLVYVYYAVIAVAAIYSVYMIMSMSKDGQGTGNTNGDGLELNPAKANSAKLGDPIRELFGRRQIYPDYVVQPVNRFAPNNIETYRAHLFLSLGVGEFEFDKSDIRIGNTPISALGSDVDYVVYPPGADVSGDFRSENWWSSTEVGGTSSGAGLDMGLTAPDGNTVAARTAKAVGYTVFFDIMTSNDKADFKKDWVVNKDVVLRLPAQYSVTETDGYSVISGDVLKELNASINMPVTLYIGKSGFDLVIASYQDSQLNADSGDSKPITPRLTLAYADGTPFAQMNGGDQRLSISHRGCNYRIRAVDGLTATLDRLINGVVDTKWTGFIERDAWDFVADNINDKERWAGPFLACPENEKVDIIELNFSFPSGICDWDSDGDREKQSVLWAVEYRYVNQTEWTHFEGKWYEKNINGLGYTLRYELPYPGLVEVRARRRNKQNDGGAHDSMYWQALRGRLLKRPTSYKDITTIAISVTTGGKLAAQSDRRVNIVATRKYKEGQNRSISGAIKHVLNSIGVSHYDTAAIDELENQIWTPNQQFFDYQTDQTQSVLDVLQKICTAGYAYPYLSDGLVSVGYDGEKNWVGVLTPHEMTEALQTGFTAPSDDDYDGIDVTYVNSRTWSEETVLCRLDDVETPKKVESYKLAGVVNEDQAYRIGMRRLMKYHYQRLTFSCKTELDGLCYNFGDRLVLTDDIPTHKTISCLITGVTQQGSNALITVSEKLDWTYQNPRVLIRWQDGSASALLTVSQTGNKFSFNTHWLPEFNDLILDDAAIEPPRLIFCESKQIGYNVIIDNIEPENDGTCTISAHEYQLSYYDYDTAIYPFGDKNYLTSKPYPYVDVSSFSAVAKIPNDATLKTLLNQTQLNDTFTSSAAVSGVVMRDALNTCVIASDNVVVSAELGKAVLKDLLNSTSADNEPVKAIAAIDRAMLTDALITQRPPPEDVIASALIDKVILN